MAWTVLVTGASGLIGGELCRALEGLGHRVIALSRGSGSHLHTAQTQPGGLSWVGADVRDAPALEGLVGEHGVDTVLHLAGQSQIGAARETPGPTFGVNVGGTWAVLEACRQHGVRRVVVASSDKVYAPGLDRLLVEDDRLDARSPYEASKVATEALCATYFEQFALPVAMVRLANVYGGGDRNLARVIPGTVADVLAGRAPVIRSDGSPERDYIHVEDAVGAYLAVARALDADDGTPATRARGQAFNAGSGRAHSVREVVEMVCRLAGLGVEPEILGREPTEPGHGRRMMDFGRLQRLTGWTPGVELQVGLARTIEWHRRHDRGSA